MYFPWVEHFRLALQWPTYVVHQCCCSYYRIGETTRNLCHDCHDVLSLLYTSLRHRLQGLKPHHCVFWLKLSLKNMGSGTENPCR